MTSSSVSGGWLTSKKAEKALRVDSCKLMHLRLEGKLRFKKKGNAFLYSREDMTNHQRGKR